ncbi:hypothetical protein OHB14_50325 [Streptomyces sp. NBC_01613]|uniref:hypothetical protein n=1 Tax=Streptomyces sp. NBC_01613 TaxID=2975896 RepID=UPI0038654019
MLASQLGTDCAQALARLRGHAFLQGRPLLDVARGVLAHKLRLDVDDAPAP